MTEPNSTSEALGGAGTPPEITWNKKTWKVGHANLAARIRLENIAVANAIANVEALQGKIPPASYLRREAALDAAIQGGKFKTWGAGWVAVTDGAEADKLYLLALLQEYHPEATAKDVDGMLRDVPLQVKAALYRTMPGFFTLLIDDPKIDKEHRPALIEKLTASLERLNPATSGSQSSPSS